jgi:ABC-type dipeptide/oligopeptide/nickel transport system permease subunit
MTKNQAEESKRPGYYIKKRLLANKPAIFGMVIILLSLIIALLGYLIMPDNTPNANDGSVQIQKKLPGFSVKLIKVRKSIDVVHLNPFVWMFTGQESIYTIIPVESYKVNGAVVEYEEYGRPGYINKLDLITAVMPVYMGNSTQASFVNGMNYEVQGEKVKFLNLNEKIEETTLTEIKDQFIKKQVEKRVYLLGTDKAGRDMLSRLLFGARISLAIGFIAVVISLFVGGILGSLAGYFGGWIDTVVMWLMTVVWSIPGIMLVIAISLALGSKGIWVAFVAVGLTTWVEIARVIRGQIMSIKEKTYVEAAKALGLKNQRIILRHILPNLLGTIIVVSTSNFANAILMEAGLSFLGLGVQPPMPSWGMMVNEGFQSIGTKNSWHLVVLPSVLISLLVLAFNLFGNGLRDAYDPQGANKL